MTPRIAQQMKLANVAFIVVRDPLTQEVVSVAQWTLLANDTLATLEGHEEQAERQAFEDEVYRSSLPQNSNKDLIMDFTIGLRTLKQKVISGRKHYALDNLATHPRYRGQGLAARLVEWMFAHADADDALVYLETASDSSALQLFRRLGFEEQGRHTIEDLGRYAEKRELEQYGGIAAHTHVALVRCPQRKPA
jgi:ribosomal protein S18 acetylase RimI-like enzyme